MIDRDPQYINDRLVRSYTTSSTFPNGDQCRFEVTIKLVSSGIISSLLHHAPLPHLKGIRLLGVGGDFQLPSSSSPYSAVWCAAGSGLTPFMAFCNGLSESSRPSHITLLLSLHWVDHALAKWFAARVNHLEIFFTDQYPESTPLIGDAALVHSRRIFRADLERAQSAHATATNTLWFLCGPKGFKTAVQQYLKELSVEVDSIVSESFYF
jgi:nitric oxide dioxygenase